MRTENDPSTTNPFERTSVSTIASRYPLGRRAQGLNDNPWRLAKLGSTSGFFAALRSGRVAGDSRSLSPSHPTSCHNPWAGTQRLSRTGRVLSSNYGGRSLHHWPVNNETLSAARA